MLGTLSGLPALPQLELVVPEVGARDAANVAALILLTLLLGLEVRSARGDPARRRRLRESVPANLGLLLFNDLLLSLVSASSLLFVAGRWFGDGLLSRLGNPFAHGLATFVLLDLTLYLWHSANHRFEGLWRFHKVHHSDLSMNASTAFRLHFMEVLLTVLVKAAFIIATGAHPLVVLLSEAVMTLFVVLHHSSLSLPGDKWLGLLIITPSLHRSHHSAERREHDRNYGAVLSLWDRVFGTLTHTKPARLGLKSVEAQRFLDLLKFGFTKNYARCASDLTAMIAEAAYFKAEKRGFAPGFEILDWLDAEREILDRVGRA